eukprot:gnl/MRDRNA2_/MRDRNA2_59937_c0_seq2.p1 gnl/MRDRNA2_/MRDRNA2_59937_c0~~gnl/MRDRNA2_/MRDRNA2_59937_c0_seq2.p1  ORF type:complete len:106 (+),score=19.55 gnl/MRDRNA2_/MRDRNA2_59937_c0_seq2:35-319(+)
MLQTYLAVALAIGNPDWNQFWCKCLGALEHSRRSFWLWIFVFAILHMLVFIAASIQKPQRVDPSEQQEPEFEPEFAVPRDSTRETASIEMEKYT